MFALNQTTPTTHPSTEVNAQTTTSGRLRCMCGSCATCNSTSVLPLGTAAPDGAANHTTDLALTKRSKTREGAVPSKVHGSDRASGSISQAAMTAAVNKFESIVGEVPLGHATPANVQVFVDGLRREGRSDYSVWRHLRAMQAVTQLLGAFESSPTGHANPFAAAATAFARAAEPQTERPPLALDKLQRLLSFAGYLATRDSIEAPLAERFWGPLLSLFTCARPKEVVRLQVSDLERHEDAWFLRLTSTMQLDRRTGRPATHWVPLHEELIRCGFVAYAAQRRLQGHLAMFGENSDAAILAARAHRMSYWFSNLGRSLELSDECSIGGLRMAFIAACVRSGIPDSGVWGLVGRSADVPSKLWSPQLSQSEPGALEQAVSWVRQLRFEGLDLSHLYVRDPLAGAASAFPHGQQPMQSYM